MAASRSLRDASRRAQREFERSASPPFRRSAGFFSRGCTPGQHGFQFLERQRLHKIMDQIQLHRRADDALPDPTPKSRSEEADSCRISAESRQRLIAVENRHFQIDITTVGANSTYTARVSAPVDRRLELMAGLFSATLRLHTPPVPISSATNIFWGIGTEAAICHL